MKLSLIVLVSDYTRDSFVVRGHCRLKLNTIELYIVPRWLRVDDKWLFSRDTALPAPRLILGLQEAVDTVM